MTVLTLALSAASIYAYSEASVENYFSTGIVNIALEEYQKDADGEEIPWKDMENVLPGDKISKIPRIINYGNDCYVRAKVEFVHSALDMNDVYGMSETWFMANDGYYYYKNILPQGECIELFQGIQIPENFRASFESESFQINIYLDAIQSEHFTPDFAANQPWGNVEILQCENEANHQISLMKQSEKNVFQIQYEGASQQLLTNASDFFSNFPIMLPGDVFSDCAELVNKSPQRIHLYFRTSKIDTETSKEIFEKLHLKITKMTEEQSEIIYDGALDAKSLNEGICLGTFDAGEQSKLNYEISVPEELNNVYSLMNEKVVWVFSTEPIEEAPVSTGDSETNLKWGIGIFLGALCVIGFIIKRYKRGVM